MTKRNTVATAETAIVKATERAVKAGMTGSDICEIVMQTVRNISSRGA